jgi:hypothetical protein
MQFERLSFGDAGRVFYAVGCIIFPRILQIDMTDIINSILLTDCTSKRSHLMGIRDFPTYINKWDIPFLG